MLAWLFLFFAAISALATFNLYHPRYYEPRLSVLSFAVGWLWGELAIHSIVFQALVVALFARLGVLDSTIGWIALATIAVSCGVQMFHYLGAAETAEIAERALQNSLGTDYSKRIIESLGHELPDGPRFRELVRPFKMRHPEVHCDKDIVFSRQQGRDLKLDVYRHESKPTNCPVLLQIHGGGWMIGDKKEQALPLMNQLASKGWLCVSSNYRLSPHATFPDHLIDVKSAIAWIRRHGREYGADPNFIVITGGSAGGHLSSLAALTANEAEYQPEFEDVDTSVAACVPLYGVYDFTDRNDHWPHKGLHDLLETTIIKGHIDEVPDTYRKASPVDCVHEERPPFFVIHGENDTLAPVADARMFVDHLRRAGDEPVVYAEVPRAQHAFEIFCSLRSQLIVDSIERFVTYVYANYVAEQAVEQGEGTHNGALNGFDREGITVSKPVPS